MNLQYVIILKYNRSFMVKIMSKLVYIAQKSEYRYYCLFLKSTKNLLKHITFFAKINLLNQKEVNWDVEYF